MKTVFAHFSIRLFIPVVYIFQQMAKPSNIILKLSNRKPLSYMPRRRKKTTLNILYGSIMPPHWSHTKWRRQPIISHWIIKFLINGIYTLQKKPIIIALYAQKRKKELQKSG